MNTPSLAAYIVQKQLERLLEEARAGTLRALVFASVDAQGEISTGAIGTPANIAAARRAFQERAK